VFNDTVSFIFIRSAAMRHKRLFAIGIFECASVSVSQLFAATGGADTDRVDVSLFASAKLNEEHRRNLKLNALGALEAYPERIDGHIGIPRTRDY
jgi:hypothetical protein